MRVRSWETTRRSTSPLVCGKKARQYWDVEGDFETWTHLVSLGGNGVNLVDEDDSRRVLLSLLERLPQVALRLSRHLTHDLGTVDEEEEGSGLVRDGSRHERLSGTGGSEHEDTARGLDTDRLEELGVTEGEFDEFTDLRHLLAASSDVVVSDVGKVALLILTLDGLSLCRWTRQWGGRS
jgi:hypothetical protein